MLRVGLLQCDSLDPPHVDVDGDYDVLFTELLARPGVELVLYRADLGHLPVSTGDCDAWLVPGSRLSVYDDFDWIHELRRFVARALEEERPLVGVCFGHQMIAQVMGATVERAAVGWNIGAITYELVAPPPGRPAADPDAGTGPASFTLIASHQDQVESLPGGARLLATGPACPIAGYTVGTHVLTVQGHPEFGAELAASLYRSRVERIGAEPIAAALASLDTPLDRGRVSDWIIDFVRTATGAQTGP